MYKKIMLIAVVVMATTGFSPVVLAQSQGNNGTLKVHEFGTPSGTKNTDPKVCVFNFEGFGFDPEQSGYIQIDGQGQTTQNYGDFNFGPTNEDGYYATAYFNQEGGTTIANGHYKATLYGKDTSSGKIDLEDEKAKSKVFKVVCAQRPDVPEVPKKPVTPTKPETPVVPQTPGVTLGEQTQVVTPAGGVSAGGGGAAGSIAASLFGLGSSLSAIAYGALRLRKND